MLVYVVLLSGLQMAAHGWSAPLAAAAVAEHAQHHGTPSGYSHEGNDLCCCLVACGVALASTPEQPQQRRDLERVIVLPDRVDASAPRVIAVAAKPPARGPPATI
jgi:hypothetical protein